MKIRISTIGPEGLIISETTALKPLNDRLQEGRSNDIVFVDAPRVELKISRTPSGALATGTVRSRYKQPCSLCLKDLERDLEVEINYALQQLGRHDIDPAQPMSPPFDDIGIIYFQDEHVELEETLQESLILGLSRFWHPPADDKGQCSVCGKPVDNTGGKSSEGKFKLGELLKKAGVS